MLDLSILWSVVDEVVMLENEHVVDKLVQYVQECFAYHGAQASMPYYRTKKGKDIIARHLYDLLTSEEINQPLSKNNSNVVLSIPLICEDLAKDDENINDKNSKVFEVVLHQGDTLLHLAARIHDANLSAYCIQKNADIMLLNEKGQTALCVACEILSNPAIVVITKALADKAGEELAPVAVTSLKNFAEKVYEHDVLFAEKSKSYLTCSLILDGARIQALSVPLAAPLIQQKISEYYEVFTGKVPLHKLHVSETIHEYNEIRAFLQSFFPCMIDVNKFINIADNKASHAQVIIKTTPKGDGTFDIVMQEILPSAVYGGGWEGMLIEHSESYGSNAIDPYVPASKTLALILEYTKNHPEANELILNAFLNSLPEVSADSVLPPYYSMVTTVVLCPAIRSNCDVAWDYFAKQDLGLFDIVYVNRLLEACYDCVNDVANAPRQELDTTENTRTILTRRIDVFLGNKEDKKYYNLTSMMNLIARDCDYNYVQVRPEHEAALDNLKKFISDSELNCRKPEMLSELLRQALLARYKVVQSLEKYHLMLFDDRIYINRLVKVVLQVMLELQPKKLCSTLSTKQQNLEDITRCGGLEIICKHINANIKKTSATIASNKISSNYGDVWQSLSNMLEDSRHTLHTKLNLSIKNFIKNKKNNSDSNNIEFERNFALIHNWFSNVVVHLVSVKGASHDAAVEETKEGFYKEYLQIAFERWMSSVDALLNTNNISKDFMGMQTLLSKIVMASVTARPACLVQAIRKNPSYLYALAVCGVWEELRQYAADHMKPPNQRRVSPYKELHDEMIGNSSTGATEAYNKLYSNTHDLALHFNKSTTSIMDRPDALRLWSACASAFALLRRPCTQDSSKESKLHELILVSALNGWLLFREKLTGMVCDLFNTSCTIHKAFSQIINITLNHQPAILLSLLKDNERKQLLSVYDLIILDNFKQIILYIENYQDSQFQDTLQSMHNFLITQKNALLTRHLMIRIDPTKLPIDATAVILTELLPDRSQLLSILPKLQDIIKMTKAADRSLPYALTNYYSDILSMTIAMWNHFKASEANEILALKKQHQTQCQYMLDVITMVFHYQPDVLWEAIQRNQLSLYDLILLGAWDRINHRMYSIAYADNDLDEKWGLDSARTVKPFLAALDHAGVLLTREPLLYRQTIIATSVNFFLSPVLCHKACLFRILWALEYIQETKYSSKERTIPHENYLEDAMFNELSTNNDDFCLSIPVIIDTIEKDTSIVLDLLEIDLRSHRSLPEDEIPMGARLTILVNALEIDSLSQCSLLANLTTSHSNHPILDKFFANIRMLFINYCLTQLQKHIEIFNSGCMPLFSCKESSMIVLLSHIIMSNRDNHVACEGLYLSLLWNDDSLEIVHRLVVNLLQEESDYLMFSDQKDFVKQYSVLKLLEYDESAKYLEQKLQSFVSTGATDFIAMLKQMSKDLKLEDRNECKVMFADLVLQSQAVKYLSRGRAYFNALQILTINVYAFYMRAGVYDQLNAKPNNFYQISFNVILRIFGNVLQIDVLEAVKDGSLELEDQAIEDSLESETRTTQEEGQLILTLMASQRQRAKDTLWQTIQEQVTDIFQFKENVDISEINTYLEGVHKYLKTALQYTQETQKEKALEQYRKYINIFFGNNNSSQCGNVMPFVTWVAKQPPLALNSDTRSLISNILSIFLLKDNKPTTTLFYHETVLSAVTDAWQKAVALQKDNYQQLSDASEAVYFMMQKTITLLDVQTVKDDAAESGLENRIVLAIKTGKLCPFDLLLSGSYSALSCDTRLVILTHDQLVYSLLDNVNTYLQNMPGTLRNSPNRSNDMTGMLTDSLYQLLTSGSNNKECIITLWKVLTRYYADNNNTHPSLLGSIQKITTNQCRDNIESLWQLIEQSPVELFSNSVRMLVALNTPSSLLVRDGTEQLLSENANEMNASTNKMHFRKLINYYCSLDKEAASDALSVIQNNHSILSMITVTEYTCVMQEAISSDYLPERLISIHSLVNHEYQKHLNDALSSADPQQGGIYAERFAAASLAIPSDALQDESSSLVHGSTHHLLDLVCIIL